MDARICSLLFNICLLAVPALSSAGSTSSTFRVTATLDPTCTIQTTPATFGHYNPLTSNVKQPLDVNSTVTITCSKGMATTIALDRGQYGDKAQGTTRAMKHASADEYLSYDLYQDVYRATLWGTAGQNIFVPPVAPDTNPRTFLIFGRIFPAQDVMAGDYSDAVVAIVNF